MTTRKISIRSQSQVEYSVGWNCIVIGTPMGLKHAKKVIGAGSHCRQQCGVLRAAFRRKIKFVPPFELKFPTISETYVKALKALRSRIRQEESWPPHEMPHPPSTNPNYLGRPSL